MGRRDNLPSATESSMAWCAFSPSLNPVARSRSSGRNRHQQSEEFKVRKKVTRKGKKQTEWVTMRKGVAYLFRYREVSLQANSRYLDALALVDDPTQAKRNLDRVTTPKKDAAGAVAPVSTRLHAAIPNCFSPSWPASCLKGFSNRDIRAGSLQPVICELATRIQERKAPRLAESFADSTLTV